MALALADGGIFRTRNAGTTFEELWDLRYQGPDPIPGQPAAGRGGGGGRGGRGGGGGPKVQPGTYTATLSGPGWEQSQTFEVRGVAWTGGATGDGRSRRKTKGPGAKPPGPGPPSRRQAESGG